MPDNNALIAAVTGGILPQRVSVAAGELRVSCVLWGDQGDPTVLLVHGNGGHAHWWDALVPYLVPGYRLVAPDLRGHGESDWPGSADAYRIEDHAADLAAVADALAPRRFAIVSHSMGARAALWYSAAHAERVRGLALLDTTLMGVDAAIARQWRGRVVGRRDGRDYPSYADAIGAFRFVPAEEGVSAAIRDDLAHHAVHERRPGVWTFRFDRAVLSLEGDGAGDIRPQAAALPCPLWVGRGAASAVNRRREFDRLAADRPQLEIHDFAGGHHFFLSDPHAAGTALRGFVDQLPA